MRAAARVPEDMDRFPSWFEAPGNTDPLLIAGLAHLWFVTIHPFDDGNGRIARGQLPGYRTRLASALLVPAQHLPVLVEDFDLALVDAYGDGGVQPRRQGRVAGTLHLDETGIVDGAGFLAENRNLCAGSAFRYGFSSANIASTWRFLRPWMRGAAQRSSQCASQLFCSSIDSNWRPLSAVPCVCWIAFSTAPFRSGSRTRHGSATTP